MLSRWFKRGNRLDHPDRLKRLETIEALNTAQAARAQDALIKLAYTDTDLEVRKAALAQVLDPDALAVLLDKSELAEAAAQQIAYRIRNGAKAACLDDERVLQARISQARADDIDTLLPDLRTPDQAAQLALQLPSEARQQVLEHTLLNSEDGLTVLQRAARGKDKHCHRYAKNRLETIKNARSRCIDLCHRLSELEQSINKALDSKPADRSGLISHHQRLAKLADMHTGTVAKLGDARTALSTAGGDASDFPLPDDPLNGLDLSIPEPAEDPFAPLVENFSVLREMMRQGNAIDEVAEQCNALTNEWLNRTDGPAPNASQHKLFEEFTAQFQLYQNAWNRLDGIHGWRDALPAPLPAGYKLGHDSHSELQRRSDWHKRWGKALNAVQWPAQHAPPQEVSEASAAHARISTELEQLKTLLQVGSKELRQNIVQASAALEDGQLESARKQLKAARSLQKAGVQGFQRELSSLSAKVAEYRDWQQFATDPKRHDLLAELETLAEQPLEPPSQAARLRNLRQQWRQLGKPASAAEYELQQRFDKLAEAAFGTCRTYYAQQAELQTANLSQREALCDQLEGYLSGTDWDEADMQAAETILRQARAEWHKHHPCEKRALKPVQQRFEALQNQLHGKVKTAWDANAAAKKAIVAEASALLEADVNSQVEQAKKLQRRWREIGSTPRSLDQRLWREFRGICDQIFTQRDAARLAHKTKLDDQFKALEQHIEILRAASEGENPSHREFSDLRGAIDALTKELPLNRAMHKRIDDAQNQYEQALLHADRTRALAELEQWRNWDIQVSVAEQNNETLASPQAIFDRRVKGDASPTDWLTLVLEAEIAADVPSPAEDRSARMKLQIEFMNTGRRDLSAEDYHELVRRWCSAGPKDPSVASLRIRFFDALAKRV